MAKFPGKSSAVLKDGISIGMNEFELDLEDDDVDSTDFDSAGYETVLSGMRRGTATVSGPLNSGTLGISLGSFYTFKFVFGGSGASEVAFTAECKVSNIKRRSKATSKEPVGITLKLKISGAFSPAVA